MSDIRKLLDFLQDTDQAADHLQRAVSDNPHDEVLKINAEALAKRRTDLERRLNYELRLQQADLVQYKIVRSWSASYPARAVAASLLAFQELVTAIFDALRTAPKIRYRPSAENIELSSLEFAAARSGSVLVSLSLPNERLLLAKSELDATFDYVGRALTATSDADFRDLVKIVGIASVSKAYAWADTSASFGIDTTVNWGKNYSDMNEVTVTRERAQLIKEILETTSDEEFEFSELDCILHGFDGDTSYFHIKTAEKIDLKGELAPGLPKQVTTGLPYHVRVMKTTRTKYATGEVKEHWTLLSLVSLERLPELPA